MTRQTELNALADRVESGEPSGMDKMKPIPYYPDMEHAPVPYELYQQIAQALNYKVNCSPKIFAESVDGSLDAAKRMHEELLPGCAYYLRDTKNSQLNNKCEAQIWPNGYKAAAKRVHTTAPTLSAAWVAAILRALASMEEGES